MNKCKLLILLPIIALSSCGLGREVKAEDAAIKAAAMEKAASKDDDEYGVELEMKYKSVDTRNGEKVNTSVTYSLAASTKNDLHVRLTGTVMGKKQAVDYYEVANDKYGLVVYAKGNIDEDHPDNVDTVAYSVAKPETGFIDLFGYAEMIYNEQFSLYYSPTVTLGMLSSEEMASWADKNDIKVGYYSSGDKNLSILATVKLKTLEGAQDNETKSRRIQVTYDENRLSEIEYKTEEVDGDYMSIKLKAVYKKGLRVFLPSGYEKQIIPLPSGGNNTSNPEI